MKPFLYLLVAVAPSVAAVAPDPIYKALREAPLTEMFTADNIVLKRDAGVVTLKRGTIALTAPVNGRDTVAVFSGEGEFTLTPASAIERNYLKSLTEQEAFKDTFDRAVFIFTDDTAKEIRPRGQGRPADAKLADVLRDHRKRVRADAAMENIEAGILADLYREGQAGFFSAYLHGRKHNDLRFHVKPRGAWLDLSPEEVLLYSVQPRDVADLFLYHGPLGGNAASLTADKRVVEAQSYKISTEIAKNDRFTATTELRFKVLSGGERVIPMELLSTLRVSKVTLDGAETAFIQEDRKDDPYFHVVTEKPLEKGSVHTFVIDYQGDKVVRKAGGGNFSVGARDSWYPNVNSFKDHAPYELTFKVPKQYTLVSVGKLVKEWTEKDMACSQWTSEAPLAVAGFNYGSFKKKQTTEKQSGIAVEGYATSEIPDYLKDVSADGPTGVMAPSVLVDKTLAETQVALQIFNAWFGKSEFGRIAITQQPQFSFGQSWPTLVYLPLSAYLDSTQRKALVGMQNRLTDFVDEVTAHEVSHQWWGHMVGWSTYHDQWLSEGFADFSAGLYLQYTNKTPDKYLKYYENSAKRLLEKNQYGRRAADAGPISLGIRLSSDKNDDGYAAVVYNKGGYVLHMLRWMMYDAAQGDKPFMAMMHDFVSQHMNRNASTASFQQVVEKHMRPVMNVTGDGKMDWFFQQWIHGTVIPRYKLEQTVTANPDGSFQLKGNMSQGDVPEDFKMIVPLYADFEGRPIRLGSVRMVGAVTVPFDIQLPKKPRRVLLNANHDVLEQ